MSEQSIEQRVSEELGLAKEQVAILQGCPTTVPGAIWRALLVARANLDVMEDGEETEVRLLRESGFEDVTHAIATAEDLREKLERAEQENELLRARIAAADAYFPQAALEKVQAIERAEAAEARVQALEGAAKADAERLQQACERAGVPYFGCDSAEHLADTILELRQQVGHGWIPVSQKPEREGRYLVQYRYKQLPPKVFIGDFHPDYGWSAMVEDAEILRWKHIAAPPEGK